jgi:ABC-type phosphate transport system permease subunit
VEASSLPIQADGRSLDERSSASRLADPIFRWGLRVLAALILGLIVFFFYFLIRKAEPALSKFGVFGFTFGSPWDVSRAHFGAWPLLAGTLISSAIALVLGVPVAVATAPFVGGEVAGPNYFIAGLILAIMILPIVSAISREVMATVPPENKEAALALGATRWEMIRMAVLPYSRAGIVGASMLGLGRAIGETIAVTLVIGNSPEIGKTIFSQGYTLAAVIANEFGEAANNKLHTGALIAAGLVLFVLTLVVNALARAVVNRGTRRMAGEPASSGAGATTAAVGA